MLIAKVERDECGKIVRTQSLSDHSLDVSKRASINLAPFGFCNIGKLAGLLHDMGKAKNSFQKYILEGTMPRGSVIHSRAGAMFLFEITGNKADGFRDNITTEEKLTVQIVSMAIMGHHTGPQDIISFVDNEFYQAEKAFSEKGEDISGIQKFLDEVADKNTIKSILNAAIEEIRCFLKEKMPESFSEYEKKSAKEYRIASRNFLAELVASAVIDGDRASSKAWETGAEEQYQPPNWNSLEESLNKHLSFIQSNSFMGKMRQKLSDNLFQEGKSGQGLYELWAPTGFGKTLASIRYSVEHAKEHGLSRIIYVIPYTSIIDQTAKEFKSIFGEDMILEHHSNIQFQNDKEGMELLSKYEEAQQVWDRPIILTTMVRFLDICYSMGNTDLRRLTYLTNSVIVFDEIQSLPKKCTYPFFMACEFLKTIGKSTLLLCSATIPKFESMKFPLLCDKMVGGITDNDEKALRRTHIEDISFRSSADELWHKFTSTELVDKILSREERTILVIHNTKKAARSTFSEIKTRSAESKNYLLTTDMCPAHRKSIIKDIEKYLKDVSSGKVYIVATQLIEAGVDISADVVFRSQSGLDNDIQAAGRCNRHGNGDSQNPVYIFWSAEEFVNNKGLQDIREAQNTYRDLLVSSAGEDIQSGKMIARYFEKKFYSMEAGTAVSPAEFPYEKEDGSIFRDFSSIGTSQTNKRRLPLVAPFKKIGENFRVIDDSEQISIIVPYGKNAEEIIEKLKCPYISVKELSLTLKAAQQYTVSIFKNQLDFADNVYQENGYYFAASYDKEYGFNPNRPISDFFQ